MAYVRCQRCRGRRTLNKHPDAYVNAPKCRTPGCKSRRYTVDAWRTKHERGPKCPRPCKCLGYHFPHRRTAGRCVHNPALEQFESEEPGYQPWSDDEDIVIRSIPF